MSEEERQRAIAALDPDTMRWWIDDWRSDHRVDREFAELVDLGGEG